MDRYRALSREQLRSIEQYLARTVFPIVSEVEEGTKLCGSGCFYRSEDDTFLVSAAHVFDGIDFDNSGIPEEPATDCRIMSFDSLDIYRPDDPALDVAILKLREGVFREEVAPRWNILAAEQVQSEWQAKDAEYLLAGHPIANVALVGNKIVPQSHFQLYTQHYAGNVDGGRTPVDFFMRHSRTVNNAADESVELFPLEGASGSPVWLLSEPEDGVWTPQKQLHLCGVQISYKANHYIRAQSWVFVDEMIRRLRARAA